MKYSLHWGNSEDGYVLVAEDVTQEEAWKAINAWVKEKAPKLGLYYRSHMTEENAQHIDYGSHINFFQIRPCLSVSEE